MTDKRTKPCPDCGATIQWRSQRCASCSVRAGWKNSERRAKAVESLKKAFPANPRGNCQDCGKELKKPGAQRCVTCSNKAKATHDPYWLKESVSPQQRSERALKQFSDPQTRARWREGMQRRNSRPEFRRHEWTRGEKNHCWKGGVTPANHRVRNSVEYKEWRIAVFTRDGYTCQSCGSKGVYLHAHHKEPFALRPDLRCCVDNGSTLCRPCHRALHGLTPRSERANA